MRTPAHCCRVLSVKSGVLIVLEYSSGMSFSHHRTDGLGLQIIFNQDNNCGGATSVLFLAFSVKSTGEFEEKHNNLIR